MQDSKEIILKAAMDEFHAQGFAGAPHENIAKTSDLNKAMIYYYYQSKEKPLFKFW